MKTLVVEDDFASRAMLQHFLGPYGECHVAVNGKEAVQACAAALVMGKPYGLICMDIMMPEMSGLAALGAIRAEEERRGILSSKGAKVVMITALDDVRTVVDSFYGLCDAYLAKPIDATKLFHVLKQLNLVPPPANGQPLTLTVA